MSRLIDADVLHSALNKMQKWVVVKDNYHNEGYSYDQVHFAIDNAPTVDAEPIIRCKDCKYWLEQGHGYPNVCIRDDMELALDESVPLEMNADDFCSRGERAE